MARASRIPCLICMMLGPGKAGKTVVEAADKTTGEAGRLVWVAGMTEEADKARVCSRGQ